MFFDYILPTAVFLHYMHVNIEKLPRIHLYIINEQLYDTYKLNVGGEYTSSTRRTTKELEHLIFIRAFTDNDEISHDASLHALFHELTHLVDNIEFDGFSDVVDLDYYLRGHEIKAKCIADYFICFYKCLIKLYDKYDYLIIHRWLLILKDSLNEVYSDLNNIYNSHCNIIEYRLKHLLNNKIGFNNLTLNTDISIYTKENIQLVKSMRQIEVLRKFFNQIEEIIKL